MSHSPLAVFGTLGADSPCFAVSQLLLAWVLSNGFLVAIVLTASSTFSTTYTDTGDVQQSTSIYLTIVLYCVVVLARAVSPCFAPS